MSFESWDIPRHVCSETEQAFASGRHEVFVLWTAPLAAAPPTCPISRCVVPAQRPGFTDGGAYVHIEGRELGRIQFDNYDRGERSVIQLHTHPGANVTMSDLDRRWEVVAHVGALSIIVPQYGDSGLVGFQGCNVYERMAEDWRLWSPSEVQARLRVRDE